MRAGRSLSRQKTNGNSPADHDGERPNADSLSKTLAASEVQQRPLVDLVRRPLATLPGGSLCICLSTCVTFPTFLLPLLRRAFSQPTFAHFLAPPLYSSTSAHILLPPQKLLLLHCCRATSTHHAAIVSLKPHLAQSTRNSQGHYFNPRSTIFHRTHPGYRICFFCLQSSPQDLDTVRK